MTERSSRDRTTPTPTSQQAVEAKPTESSVLFSLRELMNIEHGRIEDDKARAEQRRLEGQRAKMEAELRIAAADEARRRAETDRAHAEASAAREEKARHEAMLAAAVERVRIEAVDAASLVRLETEHARQAEALRARSERERSALKKALFGVVGGALLLGAIGAGYVFGVVRPARVAQERARQEESAKLSQDLAARQKEIDELNAERARHTDDPRSAPAPVVETAAPTPQPTTSASVRPRIQPRIVPTTTAVPTVTAPCIDNHDPLNPVICPKH